MILLDSFLPPSPTSKKENTNGHNYKIDFILINFNFIEELMIIVLAV